MYIEWYLLKRRNVGDKVRQAAPAKNAQDATAAKTRGFL